MKFSKFILFPLFSLYSQLGIAQTKDSLNFTTCVPKVDTLDGQKVRIKIDTMPTFKGNLLNYLTKNVNYPDTEIKKDMKSKSYVIGSKLYFTFIIDTSGIVKNVCLIRKNTEDSLTFYESEIIKTVRSQPKWNPGYYNGKPVPVRYYMPFRIEVR